MKSNAIDEKIELWSESLTSRVSEIKMVNMGEMKVSIKTHIKACIYDCLKEQIPETEHELNKLKVKQYLGGNTQLVQRKIIALKEKLKSENKIYTKIDRENTGKEMAQWMRKHHSDIVDNFYKYYNKKFPVPKRKQDGE